MKNAFKDKYFSILGDSISTLDGFNPRGYAVFYAGENKYRTNVYSIDDTWWGQLIRHFGGILLANDSWSGSTVCKPPYSELESYACSDMRTSALGRDGISPDHIIVYIGTNDRGYRFPLSDSKHTDDLSVIENAYSLMLGKLKLNYPSATVWCCTFPKTKISYEPDFVFPEYNGSVPMSDYASLIKRLAAAHNARVIDLAAHCEPCDTIDSLHPTADGMRAISAAAIKEMERQAS